MSDLMTVLKTLADKRMEGTLEKLCEGDEEYSEELRKAVVLQNEYEAINLDDSQKEVIDSLLEARDCANMERVSLAYLAGMQDCLEILWELGLFQI